MCSTPNLHSGLEACLEPQPAIQALALQLHTRSQCTLPSHPRSPTTPAPNNETQPNACTQCNFAICRHMRHSQPLLLVRSKSNDKHALTHMRLLQRRRALPGHPKTTVQHFLSFDHLAPRVSVAALSRRATCKRQAIRASAYDGEMRRSNCPDFTCDPTHRLHSWCRPESPAP